jgi:DNA adenine methylase
MAKPFLKWVGGKRQLMPELLRHLPVDLPAFSARGGRYFEPFIGGGALFFNLQEQGVRKAVINDFNPELVNLYRTIQSDAAALHAMLQQACFGNTPECFAQVRAWDRAPDWENRPGLERAARFVYLNRTAFNGLWRVNSKGHFNVPFGKYANPGLPTLETLVAAQHALADVTILNGDFESACETAQAGDLVYFDPPYAPVSATSSFVGYTLKGFDDAMQRRLAKLCEGLTEKGVAWMLSNSDTPYTREVFGSIPGARLEIVQAGRSINRDGQGRGKVNEILVIGDVAGNPNVR